MQRRCARWKRAVCGLVLVLGLAASAGCFNLDYADWTDFNEAVVGGAIDGTGSFVEDTWNAILTSIFDNIRGMSEGG